MRDNYLLYKLGQSIALAVPPRIGYRIATFISDVRYIVARKDRRAVTDNLKAIFPDMPEREIRRIRIRVFRNFAKYLFDFFRFSKIDLDYIKKNIKIENIHYFDEALAKGKGVIALTGHLGNWELGAVMIALLGYPLWVVALEHQDKKVNDFFVEQRQSKGIKLMFLGKAARQCLRVLKENKILALAGDRDFTEKGVVVEFFGKNALLPLGPAAFSLTTGALIVPGFMMRNSDDSFTMKVEKPIIFSPTGDKEKDRAALMRKYVEVFEGYIRRYPDQWYMFRRFWIS